MNNLNISKQKKKMKFINNLVGFARVLLEETFSANIKFLNVTHCTRWEKMLSVFNRTCITDI